MLALCENFGGRTYGALKKRESIVSSGSWFSSCDGVRFAHAQGQELQPVPVGGHFLFSRSMVSILYKIFERGGYDFR